MRKLLTYTSVAPCAVSIYARSSTTSFTNILSNTNAGNFCAMLNSEHQSQYPLKTWNLFAEMVAAPNALIIVSIGHPPITNLIDFYVYRTGFDICVNCIARIIVTGILTRSWNIFFLVFLVGNMHASPITGWFPEGQCSFNRKKRPIKKILIFELRGWSQSWGSTHNYEIPFMESITY